MAAGAAAGALVTLLTPDVGRFRMDVAERGLSRLARIGPTGQPPGGLGFSETGFQAMNLHGRPWSPAALTAVAVDDDIEIGWRPRVRRGGDVWDLEPEEVDPRRFRVRVLDGEVERRVLEVEAFTIRLTADDLAEVFPGGIGPDAVVAVSQYGAGFGWGVEARTQLIA